MAGDPHRRGIRETAFYIDLLEEHGVLLDEPHTRQLDGKLRELRFGLVAAEVRITYRMAPGRRILLTVFRKARMRERREITRARWAMIRCMDENHVVEEQDGD